MKPAAVDLMKVTRELADKYMSSSKKMLALLSDEEQVRRAGLTSEARDRLVERVQSNMETLKKRLQALKTNS